MCGRITGPLGDMPPQTQVTPREVAAIAARIRELQRANGTDWRHIRGPTSDDFFGNLLLLEGC